MSDFCLDVLKNEVCRKKSKWRCFWAHTSRAISFVIYHRCVFTTNRCREVWFILFTFPKLYIQTLISYISQNALKQTFARLEPYTHFKVAINPAIRLFSCTNFLPPSNNFLHLLLGDNRLLPGQLSTVICPTGPGSAPDSRSSQPVRNRTAARNHRNKLIIFTVNSSSSCTEWCFCFAWLQDAWTLKCYKTAKRYWVVSLSVQTCGDVRSQSPGLDQYMLDFCSKIQKNDRKEILGKAPKVIF